MKGKLIEELAEKEVKRFLDIDGAHGSFHSSNEEYYMRIAFVMGFDLALKMLGDMIKDDIESIKTG